MPDRGDHEHVEQRGVQHMPYEVRAKLTAGKKRRVRAYGAVERAEGVEQEVPLESLAPTARYEPSDRPQDDHPEDNCRPPMPFLLLDGEASRLE